MSTMICRLSRALGLIAGLAFVSSPSNAQVTATPQEARKIAAEAYIYGFPVVDSYKTQYAQAIEVGGLAAWEPGRRGRARQEAPTRIPRLPACSTAVSSPADGS